MTSRSFGMKQHLSSASAQQQCKFIQLLLEYIVSYAIIKRVAFRAPRKYSGSESGHIVFTLPYRRTLAVERGSGGEGVREWRKYHGCQVFPNGSLDESSYLLLLLI